jgi:hypothetical protein
MTDDEPDDKAFAALSLAMPNLRPTFVQVMFDIGPS